MGTKRGRQDSNGSKNDDMKSPNGKTAKYESKKEEEEREKRRRRKKREEEIKKIEEERKEEEKREEERNKNKDKIKVFEKMGILATENYGNKENDEDNYDDMMTEFCT